jgi:hypothetical protein
VDADTKEEIQKVLNDFSLTGAENGGIFEVRGEFKNGWQQRDWDNSEGMCHSSRHWQHRNQDEHATYCLSYWRELKKQQYVVTIPKGINVSVMTDAGRIESSETLGGNAELSTTAGDIRIRDVAGAAKVQTAGGSIYIGNAGGPSEVTTAGGSITVGDVVGELKVSTAGGSIHTGKVNGPVKAKTAGGSIDIQQAMGAVQASTVGGSVRVRMAGQPKEDSDIETMAGQLRVELAPSLKLAVDAESNNGGIDSDFPLESTDRESRMRNALAGNLNGGGPRLRLRANFGGVHIDRITAEY